MLESILGGSCVFGSAPRSSDRVRSLTRILVSLLILQVLGSHSALADGNLSNLRHIIIVMQENHSFDNYFGVLPYAPGSPYHGGSCLATDHACVDGLSCTQNSGGTLTCSNSNRDSQGHAIHSFHYTSYCSPGPHDH